MGSDELTDIKENLHGTEQARDMFEAHIKKAEVQRNLWKKLSEAQEESLKSFRADFYRDRDMIDSLKREVAAQAELLKKCFLEAKNLKDLMDNKLSSDEELSVIASLRSLYVKLKPYKHINKAGETKEAKEEKPKEPTDDEA